MKAVILFACGLLVLGTVLYFAEGFVRNIPRPMEASRLDGVSSIGLNGPRAFETAERPVGTSGREAASAGVRETSPAEVPPATPGQSVELKVHADDINNDPAFVVGTGDNQMLVVMKRDTRTPAQHQQGLPPRHAIAPVDGGGHVVTIGGTIAKMPYWEETASWNLTQSETLLLAEKGVYVRADRVMPEGYTAAVTP